MSEKFVWKYSGQNCFMKSNPDIRTFYVHVIVQSRKPTFLELDGRVTRLCEFYPNGRLFTLGSYFENYKSSPRFCATFPLGAECVLILTKTGLGYIHFGRFLKPHLVTLLDSNPIRIKTIQVCQMAHFQTKNSNLGKFWKDMHWKMLVCFMAIWSILRLFGIFWGHLVYFMVIWYIFSHFGTLYQEKSGNPDLNLGSIQFFCECLIREY
jgi:hypothetical protein